MVDRPSRHTLVEKPAAAPASVKTAAPASGPSRAVYRVDQVRSVVRQARAYTAVVAVQMRALGLLAAADQERRLSAWGQTLASLAADWSYGNPHNRVCDDRILKRMRPS